MSTPIYDFINEYKNRKGIRLHMPGHKGSDPFALKKEYYADDITEIKGADALYTADGIIAESSRLTAQLYDTRCTFFSAGGSSQSIKAMCLLSMRYAAEKQMTGNLDPKSDERLVIAAGRNAHISFVQAAQLLGFEIAWITGRDSSLCECRITKDSVTEVLGRLKKEGKTVAGVYVTSPDYLGNVADIRSIAEAAHSFGTLLMCDNAHGAYLKFVDNEDGGDMHPISLGADMTSDSAHKTLTALTGGGYLHISKNAPEGLEEDAGEIMETFGSTSPSYLIMESLDLTQDFLHRNPSIYREQAEKVKALKEELTEAGLVLKGDEPLKITVDMRKTFENIEGERKVSGYERKLSGVKSADFLRTKNIEVEFADKDFLVLMLSPMNQESDLEEVKEALTVLKEEPTVLKCEAYPDLCDENDDFPELGDLPEAVYQPYEILVAPRETVSVSDALGRIAAMVTVSCPPAILPVIPGERIDEGIIRLLKYYGIDTVSVLKTAQ